jgi:low affinity Fe/Cu permease
MNDPQISTVFGRFEVFTAMRMMIFFWILAPFRLVGRCQRFGETYYLYLRD